MSKGCLLLPSSQYPAPSSSAVSKVVLLLTLMPLTASTAPWISSQDLSLRSDLETLADVGLIKTPITTYPLMWAGIIKEIDKHDIRNIGHEYKDIFWRVKSAGKRALRNESKKILKLSVASSEQVLRSFGDSARSEIEVTANSASMNKYFAWNFQVNRVVNPFDEDTLHYDGSYIAGVWGNWVTSVGKVEKWWGASWDSANLISNNARSPLAISVDRNYPDAIDSPWLSWIGPLSISGFVGQLDDSRFISDPTLAGFSFTTKPVEWLEVGLRTTTISGGSYDGIDESLNRDSKQINGLDLRWSLPSPIPTNFYFSVTDEGQEANFSTQQFGLTSSFKLFQQDWRVILESSKTYPSDEELNVAYENDYYQTGYRYNQRAIGSTYDNDSKDLTLSLIGNLTRHQAIQVKFQKLKINQLGNATGTDLVHSINSQAVDANRMVLNWDYQASRKHRFNIGVEVTDEIVDGLGRLSERVRASASWSYYL